MVDSLYSGHYRGLKLVSSLLVSLTAIFWMSRNAPPLHDIQKVAGRETS